jgi:hypothetical protein
MNSPAITRILQALHDNPGLSRQQIAERAFVAGTTLSGGGYLKAMKEAGLIHVSAWLRNGAGRFSTPLYSAGNNEDTPQPKISALTRQAPGMLRLLKSIEEYGPIDYRQAARMAELSVNTVKTSGYLKALVAQRKIHIAEWRHNRRGAMCPLYEAGPGKNMARPEVPSHAERLRTYRRHHSPNGVTSLAGQLRACALPA